MPRPEHFSISIWPPYRKTLAVFPPREHGFFVWWMDVIGVLVAFDYQHTYHIHPPHRQAPQAHRRWWI
ncbi:hypothetical protein KSC_050860 [Ktedonobacter sp. SOSP1-52]|nr:hypothetical protein KSC_050860 [Ktedonobacter sp. SOSP1-52]